MDVDDPKEVANDLVEQLVAGKPVDELQGPGLYQSVSDEKQEAINTLKLIFETSIHQAGTLYLYVMLCALPSPVLVCAVHCPAQPQ